MLAAFTGPSLAELRAQGEARAPLARALSSLGFITPGTGIQQLYYEDIAAGDLLAETSWPESVSELNIFEGRVAEVGGSGEDSARAQIDIRVDIGVPLWVRITRRSVHDLGLDVGSQVFALIKSTSIDRQILSTAKALDAGEAPPTTEEPE